MKPIILVFLLATCIAVQGQENEKSEHVETHAASQKQALVVVDGIKFLPKDSLNILESINPENIKSINVLRGEEALNLYGEEGKNGVILVTTKSFSKNEPIYIVDGIRTEDISKLDPNDIESIEVIKDKSKLSIYGDDGKNGIVKIITRKSKYIK